MTQGLPFKGILGVGIFTTLTIIGYFLLAYLYFLLCQAFSAYPYKQISMHIPDIGAVFLNLFGLTFVIMAAQACSDFRTADSSRVAAWLWVSLMVTLLCLPSLLNKSMLPHYVEIKNNLLFCFLHYDSQSHTIEDPQRFFKIILGSLVFIAAIMSLASIKAIYNISGGGEGTGDKGSYFGLGLACFSVIFSSFLFSIYLIVSYPADSGECRFSVNEKIFTNTFQWYLYFYLMIGLVICTSKRYAKYIFAPWLYEVIDEGKNAVLFGGLLVVYVGFWLLAFSDFLQALTSYQFEEHIFKVIISSIGSVFVSIARVVLYTIQYIDEIVYALVKFFIMLFKVCWSMVGSLIDHAKENPISSFFLLLFVIIGIKIKAIMEALSRWWPSLKGGTAKGLVAVGIVAVGYSIFKVVKLIDSGELPLQVIINWRVDPNDIHQVSFECENGSDITLASSAFGGDVSTNGTNTCTFSFPAGNKCNWEVVVALSNFVGMESNLSEISLARQRGVNVANRFLAEYRRSCADKAGRPKVFVLNIGSPKKGKQIITETQGSGVFVARGGTSESRVQKLLHSRVSPEEFQYWNLVDVSHEVY